MKFTVLPFLLFGALFGPVSASAIPATDVVVVSRGSANTTIQPITAVDDEWTIVEYDGPSDANGCTGTNFQSVGGTGTTACKQTARVANCVQISVNIPGIVSCSWEFKKDTCTETSSTTATVNNGDTATVNLPDGANAYGVTCK